MIPPRNSNVEGDIKVALSFPPEPAVGALFRRTQSDFVDAPGWHFRDRPHDRCADLYRAGTVAPAAEPGPRQRRSSAAAGLADGSDLRRRIAPRAAAQAAGDWGRVGSGRFRGRAWARRTSA